MIELYPVVRIERKMMREVREIDPNAYGFVGALDYMGVAESEIAGHTLSFCYSPEGDGISKAAHYDREAKEIRIYPRRLETRSQSADPRLSQLPDTWLPAAGDRLSEQLNYELAKRSKQLFDGIELKDTFDRIDRTTSRNKDLLVFGAAGFGSAIIAPFEIGSSPANSTLALTVISAAGASAIFGFNNLRQITHEAVDERTTGEVRARNFANSIEGALLFSCLMKIDLRPSKPRTAKPPSPEQPRAWLSRSDQFKTTPMQDAGT